ncbi:hypothetical protein E9O_07908 [Moraxella catarrhalis 12P80B1]|nr:hypothetical protein E9O_07908 [Moraxella catarrhalis 12P80B1]EGE17476.1 hypothetical protein E9Q_05628 [Moraxella catarrhalis BC1]
MAVFRSYFSTVNQQRYLKLEKLRFDWCWVFQVLWQNGQKSAHFD